MRFSKASKISALLGSVLLATTFTAMSGTKISPSLESVTVMHGGKTVTITRTNDKEATIPKAYAKTGRNCPPFCVQPIQVASGVDTVGELEVLGYLKRMSNGERTVMVIDSRTPDWTARGTIPGSINIPWDKINVDVSGSFEVEAEAETLTKILTEQFAAKLNNGQWDFRNAKTLVFFCNGIWCPQSSVNIKTLTKLGYPAYKIKWYRGGVQAWVSVGLTTVKP